ncbi:hypothetical protein Syun_005014 [Stephania yunnanensis]|uniref:Uncharacterized protein n=1 Tax=Stephania yunnanensis TaxID=152371 RepID=A0AAP0L401_9MAGN
MRVEYNSCHCKSDLPCKNVVIGKYSRSNPSNTLETKSSIFIADPAIAKLSEIPFIFDKYSLIFIFPFRVVCKAFFNA